MILIKILKRLEKSREFWFVILALFLFFLLRLPSLFEPLWYGDEGIYQAIGSSLNHGKLLYSEIFDNKPPLLYWLYSVLRSDQFSVRLASLIFGALAVMMFFFLSKKLFENVKNNNNIHLLTTFIFAILLGLPAIEGNIANAENFMLLPIISAGFLIFNFIASHPKPLTSRLSRPTSPSSELDGGRASLILFIAGLLLGIAFLFKIVAIFDLAAFAIFYLIANYNLPKRMIKIRSVIIGFILPLLLVSVFFIFNGTFADFVKAAFVSNISYISYGNKIGAFPILLFIKLIILGIFTLYIFRKKEEINQAFLFILIWLAFSLLNAVFPQRPYTHYLLVLIPSLSLLIGLILLNNKYQKAAAVIFLIAILIIIKGFGIPKFHKSINYYHNFLSYTKGERAMAQYQAFFDPNTPFDYEIARFIKPKLTRSDTIFVWGNNAQLYQMTSTVAPTKYVVAYHISSYSDGKSNTKTVIEKTRPRFIVIMPDQEMFPFSLIGYFQKIEINKASIYERLF